MRWGVTATPLDWKNNPPNPPCQGGFFNNPLVGRMAFTPLTRGVGGVGFQPREGERDG